MSDGNPSNLPSPGASAAGSAFAEGESPRASVPRLDLRDLGLLHGRRAWSGFCLPLAVLRVVWSDAALRRRYLALGATQLVVCAALSILFFAADVLDDAEAPSLLAAAAQLYTIVLVVQFVVLGISRDYGDALSHDISRAVGLPPERAPDEVRLRIDLPWVGRKLREKFRNVCATAAPLPLAVGVATFVAAGLRSLTEPLGIHLVWLASALTSGFSFGLALYWMTVFTVAKAPLGWEGAERAPWFVRSYDHVTRKVPGFRWWLPRAYGDVLRQLTAFAGAPAKKAEDDFALFCGLAGARFVLGVPGLVFFLRPLLSSAVTAAILGRTSSSWPPRLEGTPRVSAPPPGP